MPPIVIDHELLRRAIDRLALPQAEPGRLHLLGIRGALPAHENQLALCENRPDRFNDTLGTWGTRFMLLPGSVDPGETFTRNPMHPHGCAHLLDGCWRYRLGYHRRRKALVQAAPVRIWRDTNRDHMQGVGDRVSEGWFGLNIHAAGPGIAVADWSAGCQVVAGGWEGEAWRHFYSACRLSGQKSFKYYLFDSRDLVAAGG